MSKSEELIGVFDWERHVFQAEDPEARTIIGTLKDGSTIKGKAQEDALQPGLTYRFMGRWLTHPQYGKQFAFHSFVLSQPLDERGVVLYLARQCPGIGKRMAAAIIEAFGDEALETVRTRPEMVAETIKGITPEKAERAAETLKADQATEQTMVELIGLLGGRGFPRTLPDEAMASPRHANRHEQ